MEFKILGPLEIWNGEGRVALTGTKRQVVLATLLLAGGRPVPLDRLVDAVWGAQSPPTASKQIRNAVSDLRSLLTGTELRLAPTGMHYQLEFGAAQLDAALFEQRVGQARRLRAADRTPEAAAAFRSALRLWRGDALTGLDSAALEAQAFSLNQQRLTVIEECVDAELALGRHRELVGELSGLLAENPLHEPLAARLMRALYRSGAAAGALRIYEETRQKLLSELGADPSQQLQRLHVQILAGEADAPRRTAAARGALFVPCNTLPAVPPRFAGRIAELELLAAAGRSHAPGTAAGPAVVVLDGMTGIGKSALAVHAAHRLAGEYPDARLAADLRAHAPLGRPAESTEILGTLLRAVGVPAERIPDSAADRGGLWRSLCADRRILLLLDDAESAEQVMPLLPGTPGSLVLVTARGRVLDGLDSTLRLTVDALPLADGRYLFADVIGDARPHSEPEAVDEVLHRCGLHPQAVRLAAAKLRRRPGWSIGHLAQRLADPGRMLAELRAEEAGLTGGLDRSLRRLPPGQQQFFRQLRLLPGPRIAVRKAAEILHRSETDTEQLLEGLVEAQLLESDAPGAYRIHAVVHAFAAQLAQVTHAGTRRGAVGDSALHCWA
jgi:DNA-binding SARP family transcriptional activator